ncbi:MAG: carboxypeptidase-like regulatory domain-containing protein [Bacteroidota bacterium]
MKKLIIVMAFMVANLTNAQSSKMGSEVAKYGNVSPETVFVHYNSSLFLSGEYLYYKVYCLQASEKYSRLSKIAYVELIGEDGQVVFKHRISLNKGIGQGDFFIPTSVPSGNYKLVAYTQWMRNEGSSVFFKGDVTIVNPYRADQRAFLEVSSGSETDIKIDEESPQKITESRGYKEFELRLDKGRLYKNRQEVTLSFKNFIREKGLGHYSLSVRKTDALPRVDRPTSNAYKPHTTGQGRSINSSSFQPESKGYIISGKVLETASGQPAANESVAVSIGGEDFIFKATTTNALGAFQFAIDVPTQEDRAVVQVLSDRRDLFTIQLDQQKEIDHSNLEFLSYAMTPSMKAVLEQRSVNNQIENGYYSIKPDTLIPLATEKPFMYYENHLRYDLKDYTRFSTMEEVFTEIVDRVWTATDTNGKRIVKVFHKKTTLPNQDYPLIFIDGHFVQDPQELLDYNALQVQKVNVVQNQYQFGNKEYQGIIMIETVDANHESMLNGDHMKSVALFKPQREKLYYRQVYRAVTSETDKRIPDYRSQLLWEPSITLEGSEVRFQFYTSDNAGEYEISLEGFTMEGKPVSLKEYITVED